MEQEGERDVHRRDGDETHGRHEDRVAWAIGVVEEKQEYWRRERRRLRRKRARRRPGVQQQEEQELQEGLGEEEEIGQTAEEDHEEEEGQEEQEVSAEASGVADEEGRAGERRRRRRRSSSSSSSSSRAGRRRQRAATSVAATSVVPSASEATAVAVADRRGTSWEEGGQENSSDPDEQPTSAATEGGDEFEGTLLMCWRDACFHCRRECHARLAPVAVVALGRPLHMWTPEELRSHCQQMLLAGFVGILVACPAILCSICLFVSPWTIVSSACKSSDNTTRVREIGLIRYTTYDWEFPSSATRNNKPPAIAHGAFWSSTCEWEGGAPDGVTLHGDACTNHSIVTAFVAMAACSGLFAVLLWIIVARRCRMRKEKRLTAFVWVLCMVLQIGGTLMASSITVPLRDAEKRNWKDAYKISETKCDWEVHTGASSTALSHLWSVAWLPVAVTFFAGCFAVTMHEEGQYGGTPAENDTANTTNGGERSDEDEDEDEDEEIGRRSHARLISQM